jgi:hypothetical protein
MSTIYGYPVKLVLTIDGQDVEVHNGFQYAVEDGEFRVDLSRVLRTINEIDAKRPSIYQGNHEKRLQTLEEEIAGLRALVRTLEVTVRER